MVLELEPAAKSALAAAAADDPAVWLAVASATLVDAAAPDAAVLAAGVLTLLAAVALVPPSG